MALPDYPKDRPVIISDNAEAMRIACEARVLEVLTPIPPWPKGHICVELEHHWAMLSCFRGFDRECDNGYSAVLIPKSKFTLEQAAAFFEETINDTSDGIVCHVEATIPAVHAN